MLKLHPLPIQNTWSFRIAIWIFAVWFPKHEAHTQGKSDAMCWDTLLNTSFLDCLVLSGSQSPNSNYCPYHMVSIQCLTNSTEWKCCQNSELERKLRKSMVCRWTPGLLWSSVSLFTPVSSSEKKRHFVTDLLYKEHREWEVLLIPKNNPNFAKNVTK